MSADPEVLTQIQVCRRLGISDETWRRWRKSGHVPPPLDLPGHPRWRRVDIDRLGLQRVGRTFFGSHKRTA